MNLNFIWPTLAQFVVSLTLPQFHAPKKAAVRMKYAPLVVFSLALVTMIAASVTSSGANVGSRKEWLGIRDGQKHRQTGILKNNCEISNANGVFLAAETFSPAAGKKKYEKTCGPQLISRGRFFEVSS
jgi:hypothetical protein